MVPITKTIHVLLFLVIMASLCGARNQDKPDQGLTDIGEENLDRNQPKNPTYYKPRCVPRNGRCATDLDCCNGVRCHGGNGNLRCLTDQEYNKSLTDGFFIVAVFMIGTCIISLLCGYFCQCITS